MNRITAFHAVALEDDALTVEELANACSVQTRWVVERLESGLLGTVAVTTVTTTAPRFESAALRRARRLRALERDFDANPELAALTVDLMEEVDRLRRRLAGLA